MADPTLDELRECRQISPRMYQALVDGLRGINVESTVFRETEPFRLSDVEHVFSSQWLARFPGVGPAAIAQLEAVLAAHGYVLGAKVAEDEAKARAAVEERVRVFLDNPFAQYPS